jgi:uncharacterized protein YjbJ (UPF0337 family)
MDKDRVKGAGKKVSGSVREAAGKASDDKELEAKGKAEKTAGEVQNAAGKTKDAVRDSVKG